jgi:hypothetical protein
VCKRAAATLFTLLFCLQTTASYAAQTKTPNPAAASKKAPVERKIAAGGRVYTSLNPSDGSFINNAKPSIAAEYADDGIGINPAETKLFIDGVDVSAQAQATPNKVTYTPAAPLADGVHKVRLDIDDKAGNPATVTWTFTLHTQPPKIKINSHRPNQYVNQSPLLITGSIDNVNVRVMVNGVVASQERGVFSAKVNIVEGSNTITAVATDPFVNTGMDSIVVILDSKPPTVEITGPLANSLVSSKTVTVSGIADGKAAAVTIVTSPTKTGVVSANLAPGTFTAKEVRLEEGINTITAKAVSNAGNSATSSIKVTVDTIPPKITLTAPKDQTLTNKKMVTVTGTIDDPLATVKVNNTPVQVSKGVFTLSGVNLAEGSNTITATATDRAGNQAKAASIVVVLKTIPPAPPKLGELPFVTRDTVITVKGTAEPTSVVELYMNSASRGSMKADEKGVFSFKVSLQEGNNAFSAVTSDAVGNVSASSAVVNVFLDTKPPKIL